MTILELNQKLAEVSATLQRKGLYEEELAELSNDLNATKQEEQELIDTLKKEQKDVDQLQSLSLKSIFYTLKGTKDWRIREETDDLIIAKATLDRFRIIQDGIREQIKTIEAKVTEIKNTTTEYNDLIDKKKELIANQETEIGDQLRSLMDDFEKLQTQSKETAEAIDAGRHAKRKLQEAIKTLQSAYNWGTYDAFSRGGIISHAIKYDRIEKAQSILSSVRIYMRRFQKELKDINLTVSNITLHITDTERIVDFWFDNVFTDTRVLNKIDKSLTKAEHVEKKVTSIIGKLRQHNTKLKRQVRNHQSKIDQIINMV